MMTENRIPRKVFWSKKEEVIGWCRELRCGLYISQNIIRVGRLRRMRWAGRETYRGKEKCLQGFGGETWRKERACKTGRMINWSRMGWRRGLDLSDSGQGGEVGCYESGCEHSCRIKWWEDLLTNWGTVSHSRTKFHGIRHHLLFWSPCRTVGKAVLIDLKARGCRTSVWWMVCGQNDCVFWQQAAGVWSWSLASI
jgi:hypothetical protein